MLARTVDLPLSLIVKPFFLGDKIYFLVNYIVSFVVIKTFFSPLFAHTSCPDCNVIAVSTNSRRSFLVDYFQNGARLYRPCRFIIK